MRAATDAEARRLLHAVRRPGLELHSERVPEQPAASPAADAVLDAASVLRHAPRGEGKRLRAVAVGACDPRRHDCTSRAGRSGPYPTQLREELVVRAQLERVPS